MNKSRRMLADLSSALAEIGLASVIVDLYGTGDSEGEFHDADWDCWVDDVARTAAWAAGEGCRVRALLGVRTGCLLAARTATHLDGIEQSVFWQPVEDGRRYLTQFLRLAVAAAMMEGGSASAQDLREQIRRDGRAEIAGYSISATLADQLEDLSLAREITPDLGRQHWIEIVRDPQRDISPGSLRTVEAVRGRGLTITTETVLGEPFWASSEIVRSAGLIESTVDALRHLNHEHA